MAVDTSLAPAPHEPHGSHELGPKRKSRRLLAALTAGAVGLVGAGFAAKNFLGSGEDPSKDKRPVAVGPAVPGAGSEVEQPAPSTTTTETSEQLSPLEQQKRLFERINIPESAITYDELLQYVDNDALDIYKGVDGGVGLYPEVGDHITDHGVAFGQLTPEDIAASMDRIEHVMTGTHLDVVDGKVVTVPNTKLMEDGTFRGPISEQVIEETAARLESEKIASDNIKSSAAAGILASAADDGVGLDLAAQMMKAETRVAEYYVGHPDETQQISDTTSAGVIEATFASHGNVNFNDVANRVDIAREFMYNGTSIDLPDYASSRLVQVGEYPIKSADGSKTVHIKDVEVVGKTNLGQVFSMRILLVPAEKTMAVTPEGKFALADAPDNTFNALLVAKSTPSNK